MRSLRGRVKYSLEAMNWGVSVSGAVFSTSEGAVVADADAWPGRKGVVSSDMVRGSRGVIVWWCYLRGLDVFEPKERETGLDCETSCLCMRGFVVVYVVCWTFYIDPHGCLAAPHML